MWQRLAQPPRQHQGGQRDQQGAHETRVQQRQRPHVAGGHVREGQHGGGLQQQAKQARHPPGLAHTHPEGARTFQRPDGGRPLRVQRQRHGQRGKTHTHGGETVHQQLVGRLAPAREPQRQQQVERAKGQRRKGVAHRQVLHQPRLQAKGHQRGAEHQRGIHRVAQFRRCVAGIEDGRRHIDQHKGDEEGLGAGELAAVVLEHTPGGGHAEGGQKTQQVQHAPRALEGDEQNGEVEHQVVAEQPHMAALPGRQQHRHREAASKRRHGKCARVLQQRQRTAQRTHHDHQPEGQQRRQQAIQAEGREHGEVEHGHTTTLQRQRKTRLGQAPAEAHGQQGHARGANGGQPQLHREQAGHGRITRQEGQADEQNHQPDPHDGVAAQQPVAGSAHGLLDDGGFGRCGGWGWGFGGRTRNRRNGHRCHGLLRRTAGRTGGDGDVGGWVGCVQVQRNIDGPQLLLGGREIGGRLGCTCGCVHLGHLGLGRRSRSGIPCSGLHLAAHGHPQGPAGECTQHCAHYGSCLIPARPQQAQDGTPYHAP